MICAKSEVDDWHLGLVTKSKVAKRQVQWQVVFLSYALNATLSVI